MSFWTSQSGAEINGSEENSHVGSFKTIPDGTTAPGIIKSAELTEYEGKPYYQINYQLVSGDYKGNVVRQKIQCFHVDNKKRDRSVNMLMRLYKIANVSLTHSDAPDNNDLLPLKNKVIGLKIQEWFADGKEGNWISEIHEVSPSFVTATGMKVEHTHINYSSADDIDSALSRNAKVSGIDDDIPF